MDCRWTFCLAAALVGAAGCEHLSLWPQDDKTKAEKEREARCVWVEQTKLKPETLVAHANLLLTGAEDATATEDERERRREKARDDFQRALKEDPDHLPAYLGLARLFESTGRHDRAVETYHAALEKHPKAKEVWFELGYKVHAPHKEWEPAVECLRKALALDPDNRPYAKSLGFLLARAGHYEESFGRLRPVLGEGEAHAVIGKMLHHLGQDDAARKHAELALQVDPKLKSARELIDELDHPGAARAPEDVGPEAAAEGVPPAGRPLAGN